MIKWIKNFFEKEEHIVLDEDRKKYILNLLETAKATENDSGRNCSLKYKLNPVVSMDKVLKAEINYRFRLPEDYFWFITNVGNGGTGPCYQIEQFKTEDIDYLKSLTRNDLFYDDDLKGDNDLYEQLLYLGIDDNSRKIYIVISGKNSGQIMYERIENGKPLKHYGNSFLEWYECLLTQNINKEILN